MIFLKLNLLKLHIFPFLKKQTLEFYQFIKNPWEMEALQRSTLSLKLGRQANISTQCAEPGPLLMYILAIQPRPHWLYEVLRESFSYTHVVA